MKNVMFKDEDHEDEVHVCTVATSLVTNIRGIHFDKNVYQAKVDLISSQQDRGPTSSKLLKCISS